MNYPSEVDVENHIKLRDFSDKEIIVHIREAIAHEKAIKYISFLSEEIKDGLKLSKEDFFKTKIFNTRWP